MPGKRGVKGTELRPQPAADLTGTAGAGDTRQTLAAPGTRRPARSEPPSPPPTGAGYPVHKPCAGSASRSELNTTSPGLGRKGGGSKEGKGRAQRTGTMKDGAEQSPNTGAGKERSRNQQ